MGERPPRKLSAAAIERCTNIARIQRRDIFAARLPKLITMACAIAGNRMEPPVKRVARARIMKTGRAFVKAVRDAPP